MIGHIITLWIIKGGKCCQLNWHAIHLNVQMSQFQECSNMKKMYIFEWQTVHSLLFMPVEKVLSVAAKNIIDFLKRLCSILGLKMQNTQKIGKNNGTEPWNIK